MTTMHQAVENYLAMRRALGFDLRYTEGMLRGFASFVESRKVTHITVDLALKWATEPVGVQPETWAYRLGFVRRFAQHARASDERHEIPPADLLPHRQKRKTPYIYRRRETRDLMRAAGRMKSQLNAASYSTLIGLLAVSGLRISEALGLNDQDVDLTEGILTVRRTKYGKSRFVPLHSSTRRALQSYLRVRDSLRNSQTTDAFFIGDRDRRIVRVTIETAFRKLSHETGLRGPNDRRGPRLHDFRHSMAVNALKQWHRKGADVDRRLPVLSAFLGHGNVEKTYWYLTATPELMHVALERAESKRERSEQ